MRWVQGNKMNYNFRKVEENDGQPVIDIFNYYIENSFAAYLDQRLGYEVFPSLVGLAKGYPFYVIEHSEDGIIGFGFLGRYHQSQTFNRVAELTYFIMPAHIKKGLGSKLLKVLSDEAIAMGVDTLLANINSLNQSSLNFHLAQGFKECGRFVKIGKKQGTDFDVIWMQKFI
jgi:phosphinothricin acetyltransferase